MDRPSSFRQIDAVTAADDITRLSCADVLNQREQPVALFTPALLVTHGGFDRDPVIEFDALFPADAKEDRPFYTELQRDHEFFFAGLGSKPFIAGRRPINWDKRLYCISKSRAEECFGFIAGIAFSDPKKGFFASVFSYDIRIPDPTSFRNQFLEVTVFGVLANTFVATLEPQLNKPAIARKIHMATPNAGIEFLAAKKIVTVFDGTDPLNMRE
jgi:hypothetical protein